jgi:AcrR family transcriptional regulator
MEAGECLFGRHGFDGISLREIASAAGQSNTNVVQYHFKNKAGLVNAILEDRLCQFEPARREMLQNLPDDNALKVRELLRILWQPSLTIRDAEGAHTFCRFLLQYMIQPHITPHPLAKLYSVTAESDSDGAAVASISEAVRLLRACFPTVPQPVLSRRWSALTMMFQATVVEHDNAQLLSDNGVTSEFDIEPILDMAIAAIGAPI